MRCVMRWVLGVVPVPVIYVDALGVGVAGEQRGPVVRIRAGYEQDAGLHAHELEHVRQFWRVGVGAAVSVGLACVALRVLCGVPEWGRHVEFVLVLAALGLHPWLYVLCRRYRASAEAYAYLEQTHYVGRSGRCLSIEAAASRLASPRYRLGFSSGAALAYLLEKA